jgi:prepilin-type N-terminal cleavage/methylation domain-containing protein
LNRLWNDRQDGFSVIELMVALIISTIMLASSIPALSRYLRDHNLLGTVENFAADMRLCRQRATTQGNNVVFSWDTSSKTYTIVDDENNNGSADAGEFTIGPKQIHDDITLTNGPGDPFVGSSVTFLPNGSASEDGELTFESEAGVSRSIILLRPTSLVKIQ